MLVLYQVEYCAKYAIENSHINTLHQKYVDKINVYRVSYIIKEYQLHGTVIGGACLLGIVAYCDGIYGTIWMSSSGGIISSSTIDIYMVVMIIIFQHFNHLIASVLGVAR